jgi:hypothetical protein
MREAKSMAKQVLSQLTHLMWDTGSVRARGIRRFRKSWPNSTTGGDYQPLSSVEKIAISLMVGAKSRLHSPSRKKAKEKRMLVQSPGFDS